MADQYDDRMSDLDDDFYQDEFGERITRADDIDPADERTYMVEDDDDAAMAEMDAPEAPMDPDAAGFRERLDEPQAYDPDQAGDMTSTDMGLDPADRDALRDEQDDLAADRDRTS